MSFWIVLWKAVFIVTVSCFGLIAVWVTIQGARDIKSLLADLREEHKSQEESPEG